jgi:hypothetical protein
MMPMGMNPKGNMMKPMALFALSLAAAPIAAAAMPVIGDVIGTNPTQAAAALKAAGCEVVSYESEDGMIDARCTDIATGLLMEIAIDPKTGAVADVKQGD